MSVPASTVPVAVLYRLVTEYVSTGNFAYVMGAHSTWQGASTLDLFFQNFEQNLYGNAVGTSD